ncbi:MAG TPA: DUF421 domain-containing protein [Actinotalea sp.]|nr:DUF421 domain-containing protein [Actinotalea sp.]
MEDVSVVWGGWEPIARIAVVGTLGYAWLVILLRGTGPRNMAKMTPFDFVVTVTLGSAFGRVLTATEVSISEAAVTFALLIGLQWLLAEARVRSARVKSLVDVRPTLLFHRGQVVAEGLRRHRLTETDLHSAARENGLGSLEEVEAMILQSDGTFAVISRSAMGDGSSVHPYVT